MKDKKLKEGWGRPILAKKWHYFVGMTSLCKHWGFYGGSLERDNNNSYQNCTICKRLFKKRQRKEATNED